MPGPAKPQHLSARNIPPREAVQVQVYEFNDFAYGTLTLVNPSIPNARYVR